MNHPEVATLDDQRAAGGGEGQLLHRRDVVVQNLRTAEREGQSGRRERSAQTGSGFIESREKLLLRRFKGGIMCRQLLLKHLERASKVLKGFAGGTDPGKPRPEGALENYAQLIRRVA